MNWGWMGGEIDIKLVSLFISIVAVIYLVNGEDVSF
jgi:hypothetical protein